MTDTVADAKATEPARAPLKAPEGDVIQKAEGTPVEAPATPKKEETPKFLGLPLPGPLADMSRSFNRTTASWRRSTVKAMPAFIVNNSSNILGLAHVGTEMLMFKSGMPEGQKLIQNPKNPINWVYEPIKTVFTGVAKNAKVRDTESFSDLMKGNPLENIRKRVTDTEAATNREMTRLETEANKKGNAFNKSDVKLANRWQMRSTFMGLVIWSLSALIPEKKETDDEVERMAIMRANHPIKYIGERLKEAVYFPEWNKHKRQMLGLGYTMIGLSSMIGAWRGRSEVNGNPGYTFNSGYFMTSLLSLFSSVPLLFAIDEKSGYGGFGSIMMLRIPFLYKSISNKFENSRKSGGDMDGARDYTIASGLFQAENAMQSLFGGAQKVKKTMPDGSVVEVIVDHNEVREKVKAIRAEKKAQKDAMAQSRSEAVMPDTDEDKQPHTPSSHISHIVAAERAMPERMAEMEAAPSAT